ncbi:hypothetical protein J6590_076599 [Homalodisca vitripennis]|nr:hypothetical protein J6590_076599 [Homalodisca vitripennis]
MSPWKEEGESRSVSASPVKACRERRSLMNMVTTVVIQRVNRPGYPGYSHRYPLSPGYTLLKNKPARLIPDYREKSRSCHIPRRRERAIYPRDYDVPYTDITLRSLVNTLMQISSRERDLQNHDSHHSPTNGRSSQRPRYAKMFWPRQMTVTQRPRTATSWDFPEISHRLQRFKDRESPPYFILFYNLHSATYTTPIYGVSFINSLSMALLDLAGLLDLDTTPVQT